MTKKEALATFMDCEYPFIVAKYGKDDRIAISEGWCNYTDYLCKDGMITRHQDETWVNPF